MNLLPKIGCEINVDTYFSDSDEECEYYCEIDWDIHEEYGKFYRHEDDEIITLTEDELNKICYDSEEIFLVYDDEDNGKDIHIEMKFTSKGGFTVAKMLDYILTSEREFRPKAAFLYGYIDESHTGFEGLIKVEEPNKFTALWGS